MNHDGKGRDGMDHDGMDHEDLEDLLAGAFDAQARSAVPDDAAPPPPRFAETPASSVLPADQSSGDSVDAGHTGDAVHTGDAGRPTRLDARRRRRARLLAPLSAAAAVVLAVGIGAAVISTGGDSGPAAGDGPGVASAAAPVHIKLLNGDGQTYGVGMPVIAYFSHTFTDARALQKATTVTVNGTRTDADWYFERSESGNGPIEGHLRPQAFWPADARIHVDIAARTLDAGAGVSFDNDLTLNFSTGARKIAKVNGATHQLNLYIGNKQTASYPVSIGANKTPTRRGIKVIMGKGEKITTGPRSHRAAAAYTQRLTYDGEFLLAAPWNSKQIAKRVNSSDGSTDLAMKDAKKLYGKLGVGDVVVYSHTGGPPMTLATGFGDWNVKWGEWRTGGLVPTH